MKEKGKKVFVFTNLFPILGGRLLKRRFNKAMKALSDVSNPWREAIEEICHISLLAS